LTDRHYRVPVNFYPNATEEELTALLESLQRRATKGEIYMTTYSGDQQMRSFQGGAKIHVEMRHVLYAGHVLFGWDDPYIQRIKRVSADYSQG
jgi:hypothetical protein